MVSVIFLIFGVIDFLAGAILVGSGISFLGDVAKFIGIALLLKGIWTIITSIKS